MTKASSNGKHITRVIKHSNFVEGFFLPMTALSFIGAGIAVIFLIASGSLLALGVAILLAAIGVAFGWLLLNFKTEIVVDGESETIFYRIYLGARIFKKLMCRYEEIVAVTLRPIKNWGRVIHSWWHFSVSVVLKNGRMIEIETPRTKDGTVTKGNRSAEKLAGEIGCEYIPGQDGKVTYVAIAGDNPIIEYRDWRWLDYFKEFFLEILLSLFMFTIILVAIIIGAISL